MMHIPQRWDKDEVGAGAAQTQTRDPPELSRQTWAMGSRCEPALHLAVLQGDLMAFHSDQTLPPRTREGKATSGHIHMSIWNWCTQLRTHRLLIFVAPIIEGNCCLLEEGKTEALSWAWEAHTDVRAVLGVRG